MSNFKNGNLREMQLRELEILREIDRICKKYNIKYFLSWGSALGAVRHKGFIPWDDDIDVSMLWTDYIRFEEVCKTELGSKFYFQSNKENSDYWMPFNKIRLNNTSFMLENYKHMNLHWGLSVDIFPIIPVPRDDESRKKQKFYVNLYNKLITRSFILKNDIGKKISVAKIYFKVIPRNINEILKKICIKNITKYSLKECDKVAELLSLDYTEKSIFDKKIFDEQIFVKFEGLDFPIPKRYDEYLRQIFDDYMKLPEEDKRVGHLGVIIDLQNSYEKYI